MDKLEPIIRHRFWILFAISLPLAITGYFLANGEMQAATEKKEQELEKVLKEVPKGTTEPNQEYADGLQVINQELQEENNIEIQKLWEAQRDRMDWPEIMLQYLPETYRGEIDRAGRRHYAREYPGIVNRLWRRVQPVVSDPPPPGLKVEWPQKVLLQPATLRETIASSIHSHAEPSSEEVWDAQEDVWLLELIFDGIVRTNQSASFVGDAPVRRIDQLYLTGGSGESSVVAQQAASGGGAGGGFGGSGGGFGGGGFDGQRVAEDYEEDDRGKGRSRSPSRVAEDGMGGGGASTAIGFDIAEEIGPEVPPAGMEAAAASAGGGFGGARQDGQRFAEDDFSGGTVSGGRGGQPAGSIKMFRYIGKPADVEKAPYHERAFYMSAIVMLPDLPGFLAELASSEWPIRIGRFHIGPNPYRDGSTRSVAGNTRRGAGLGSGTRVADTDEDDGPRFGSGLGNRLSQALSGRSLGGRSGGGGGFSSGSLVLPPTMVGPDEIDPYWFSNPDLVQVDFYGVITMYKPITNAAITKKSDGTTAAESLKEIEQTEAAEKAAEEAATLEGTTENPNSGETPDAETTEPSSSDDTARPPSETAGEPPDQQGDTSPDDQTSVPDESSPAGAAPDNASSEQ